MLLMRLAPLLPIPVDGHWSVVCVRVCVCVCVCVCYIIHKCLVFGVLAGSIRDLAGHVAFASPLRTRVCPAMPIHTHTRTHTYTHVHTRTHTCSTKPLNPGGKLNPHAKRNPPCNRQVRSWNDAGSLFRVLRRTFPGHAQSRYPRRLPRLPPPPGFMCVCVCVCVCVCLSVCVCVICVPLYVSPCV